MENFEGMKLSEFLLHHTDVGEIIRITDGGWPAALVEIDHEDLFIRYLNDEFLDRKIQSVIEDWYPITREVKIKIREVDV